MHEPYTIWLGVDDADELGVFTAGAAGAVPEQWRGEVDGGYIEGLLSSAGCPLQVDFLDDTDAVDRAALVVDLTASPPNEVVHDALLELSHPRVQDLIASAQRVPSTRGHFVLVYEPAPSVLRDLARRGAIRRVWCDLDDLLPVLLGLYVFSHPNWQVLSRPYERALQPRQPLLRATADAHVRDLAVPLPGVRFGEVEQLDPQQWVSCRTP